MSSVVIVGASHAAAEAISTLKKKGFDGTITLVGDEQYLPYQRPPLSKKYLTGEVSMEQLYIRGPATYDDFGVVQKLSTRVESINRDTKTVCLDNSENIAYDHLILATGTSARKLPVAGAESTKIKYLRTKADVDDIANELSSTTRLLIIGAGYIGLEVAASAVKQGAQVTVLEAMERVLQRVTGPEISEFYQTVHAQEGVDVRLQTTVTEFVKSDEGIAAILGDGSELAFDLAVVGIGVIPNVELAEAAGLNCDNGITVNEFCFTQDESIYAIGDCSNHPNFIYDKRLRLESVPNAMGQAKTAALSIMGDQQRYDEIPWFWSDQYDVKLQTAGLCQDYDQTIVRGNPDDRKFAVFYLREGRLLAVDAINSPAEFMLSKKLIINQATPSVKDLANPDVSLKAMIK